MLSHHCFVMFRWCRAVMYCCGKSGSPCQFGNSPDIFQMTHTVITAFFCAYNNTVDSCSWRNGIGQSIQIQLIVTIFGLGHQFRCHTFSDSCSGSLCCSERECSIFIYGQLFVVRWFLTQCIIGIACALKQGIFSCIICCAFLSSVGNCDTYFGIIGNLCVFAQIRTCRNFYRESYTGDLITACIHMVRSACQRTGSYFVLGCRGKCIYFNIVVYICFVELVVWDVHQNVSFFLCFYQRFDCCVQMLRCFIYCCLSLRVFQLIFCFLQFCLHRCPAVCGVIALGQGFCSFDRFL